VPVPSASILPSSNHDDVSPEPSRAELASPPPAARSFPRAPPSTSSDPLGEEVRLVARAEQQLNDGHPNDALRTLGEHARRFPSGTLAEQRMVTRIMSLCALGRTAEAKTELTKLARAYPGSAHLDSARRLCGIDVGAPVSPPQAGVPPK
jgi:hypothetical protein